VATVLLVDDEPALLFTLEEVLTSRGFDVRTASSGKDALDRLDDVDAVVTDLVMPNMTGIELLRAIRQRDATMPVVLLTAQGSERVAVSAMKEGAYDYLTKPFDNEELALAVGRACEVRSLRDLGRHVAAERLVGSRIIGDSAPMKRLLGAIGRVANKDVTVLVRGETGTGKELVGTLLHGQSRRAKGPLVRFNCAAIPTELADAELFGHARGAFTGAQAARRGYFARAHQGTLVLDEIGELSLDVQAKLLRALQEGEIQPVGSGSVEKVDVRIVASTNRDLLAESGAGRFRSDLYYRLAVVELIVPPLRDRRDDIAPLAQEFLRRYRDKFGVADVTLSDALVARLTAADWPGNVRQLENMIARMVALADDGDVLDEDGSQDLARGVEKDDAIASGQALREQVESFERSIIRRALAQAGGNQSKAAKALGAGRATLSDKIKKYGLGEE
jgi:two-component system response regulator AtoC